MGLPPSVLTRRVSWSALAALFVVTSPLSAQESERELKYRRRQFDPPSLKSLEQRIGAEESARPSSRVEAPRPTPAAPVAIDIRELRKARQDGEREYDALLKDAKRLLHPEITRRAKDDPFFVAYVYYEMARYEEAKNFLAQIPKMVDPQDKRLREGEHLILLALCMVHTNGADKAVRFIEQQAPIAAPPFQKRAPGVIEAIRAAAKAWSDLESALAERPSPEAIEGMVAKACETNAVMKNYRTAFGLLRALETCAPDYAAVKSKAVAVRVVEVMEKAYLLEAARDRWGELAEQAPEHAAKARERQFELERRIKRGGF